MSCLFERYGCILIEQSRFELNLLRWSARYGISAIEGVAGSAMRMISPKLWNHCRDYRQAIGQQIGLYIFQVKRE
jgi:hypothetical protein